MEDKKIVISAEEAIEHISSVGVAMLENPEAPKEALSYLSGVFVALLVTFDREIQKYEVDPDALEEVTARLDMPRRWIEAYEEVKEEMLEA